MDYVVNNTNINKICEYVGDDLREQYKKRNEKTLLVCTKIFPDPYNDDEVYFILLNYCPKYFDLYEDFDITLEKNVPYLGGKIRSNSNLEETEEEFNECHKHALDILKLFDLEPKINGKSIKTKGENYIKNVYYITISSKTIKWYNENKN